MGRFAEDMSKLTHCMLSGGGVLGLRYTRAIVDGSVLKNSSHTIRLA